METIKKSTKKNTTKRKIKIPEVVQPFSEPPAVGPSPLFVEPESKSPEPQKRKRCANGQRFNKKTQKCEVYQPKEKGPPKKIRIVDKLVEGEQQKDVPEQKEPTPPSAAPSHLPDNPFVELPTPSLPPLPPVPAPAPPINKTQSKNPPTRKYNKTRINIVSHLNINNPEKKQKQNKKIRIVSSFRNLPDPSLPVPTLEEPHEEPLPVSPIYEPTPPNVSQNDQGNGQSNGQGDDQDLKDFELQYPDMDDPNFNIQIANKKELFETRYEGSIMDVKKQAEKMCNSEFTLQPHQLFVKNFLSTNTPYNGLLLYHGLGTGKTCSAIGIAEDFRKFVKDMGSSTVSGKGGAMDDTNDSWKRIIVIASPNVQQNFRQQLFNEKRLEFEDGHWLVKNSCVGSQLLKEVQISAGIATMDATFTASKEMIQKQKERIIKEIGKVIDKYYAFYGYVSFNNYITSMKINTVEKVRQRFNDCMIIVDEIHNLRLLDDEMDLTPTDEAVDDKVADEAARVAAKKVVEPIETLDNKDENKKTFSILINIAKHTDRLKLLLMTATPMYNSYKEIINLVNLLNINDKRTLLQEKNVFDSKGNFKEDGADLLRSKMRGYVSYVRSENPYTFPFRIYQTNPTVTSTMVEKAFQIDGKKADPLQHIPVFYVPLLDFQKKKYLANLENMADLGSLSASVSASSIGMPTLKDTKKTKFLFNVISGPGALTKKEKRVRGGAGGSEDSITSTSTAVHFTNIKELVKLLNIAYPTANATDDEDFQELSSDIRNVVSFKIDLKHMKKTDYEYKPNVERIFHIDNIGKYSAKIHHICRTIKQSRNMNGVIMIYSEYIDNGIVPMALALEEMGFARHVSTSTGKGKGGTGDHTQNLFKEMSTRIDANTMLEMREFRKATDGGGIPFKQAKYAIISGDPFLSHNNTEDMKTITSKDNRTGENVKVVIISKAGAEGLDFVNVRQIHILEPWYNMSRIEQIIGRGVRNLSHCSLPFEERNVELFLYGSVIEEADKECADVYLYRVAEKKAIQVGNVTRVLKESAVDCLLNVEQNNFTMEKMTALASNQNIRLKISSRGNEEIDYQVGDKPYSAVCDYMKECYYDCFPNATPTGTDDRTYINVKKGNQVEGIQKIVIDLFRDRVVYSHDELMSRVNHYKRYPIEVIYRALTALIDHKTTVKHKDKRTGFIINRGDVYAFQPIEITDEATGVYERKYPVPERYESVAIETSDEADVGHVVLQDVLMRLIGYWKTVVADSEDLVVNKNAWNFFTYANFSMAKLRMFISEETAIQRHLVDKMIDSLTFEEKVALLKDYRQDNSPLVGYPLLLQGVEKFFQNRMFQVTIGGNDDGTQRQEMKVVYLLNKTKFECFSVVESGDGDRVARIDNKYTSKIERTLAVHLAPFVKRDTTHASFDDEYLGFFETSVFKVKTLFNKNNAGKNLYTFTKDALIKMSRDMLLRWNRFHRSSLEWKDVFNEKEDKYVHCVFIEMWMRHLRAEGFPNLLFVNDDEYRYLKEKKLLP